MEIKNISENQMKFAIKKIKSRYIARKLLDEVEVNALLKKLALCIHLIEAEQKYQI